jgi:predicted P-loop ATPase/GTPase
MAKATTDVVRVVERTITITYWIPVTNESDLNPTATEALIDFTAITPESKVPERIKVTSKELSGQDAQDKLFDLAGDLILVGLEQGFI